MILALATKRPDLFADAAKRIVARVAAHHRDRKRDLRCQGQSSFGGRRINLRLLCPPV